MLLSLLGTLVAQSGSNTTLTPDPIFHEHEINSQGLNLGLALQPAALTHAHTLASVALSSVASATLTPAALTHPHVIASPALSLSGETTLTPATLSHQQVLSSPGLTLTGVPVLQPASITHQSFLPNGQVSTALLVTPAAILHSHLLAVASLSVIGPESLLGKKIAVLIESLKYTASSTDDVLTIVVTRDQAVDVTINQC